MLKEANFIEDGWQSAVRTLFPSNLLPNNTMATTTTSTRSDSGNANENRKNDTDRMMQRMLWISRSGFLATLSCVVVSLCILYSQLLKRSELTLGEQQFYSIASRATTEASRIVRRKMHAASVLSRLIAHAHPETEPWPFVTVDGFEDISQQLIVATDGTGMAFAPFVEHASLDDFEDFAYTFYNSTRKPTPFAEGTAVSSFGAGVWGLDETLPSPDMRYHDNQIPRNYVTPNEMVVPILQHSDGPSSVLMLNLRFEESRGKAIDSLVACVTESTRPSCAEITSVIELASSEHPSPGALLLDPIQPVNGESNTSSGVVLSTLVWEELFENVFSDEVSGIYCVLEQAGTSLTYVIEDGVASLRDSLPADILKFEEFKTSVHLTPEDLFDSNSPQCILSLYPSKRFFAVYGTKNPRVAAWGTFVAIALTSLVFVLYDYFVRKEFTNKRELLEAKRKFMRWVCHEVRTPLNSLCLGLNIVRSELKNKLHELQDDGSSDQTDDSGGRDGGNGQNRSRSPPTLVQIEEWLGLTTELQANANLAVDVLSDLLNYDRIERNNLSLEMSVFQLVSLVEKTAAEFRLTAMGKHVNLVTELNCTETTLTCGDKMRLGHVLRNIIANRLKSTPAEGTVTISIKTDLFPQPKARRTFDLRNGRKTTMEPVGNATVSVVNTGEGMSADEINTLFQDGLQFDVNNLQNGNGSGLGLYISKGVVDKHGGSMFVQATGLETTMSFQLLVYGCDDSSVESPPRCGSDTATESLSAPRTSEQGFGSRSGSGSNSGSGSGGQSGGGSGSGSGSGSRSNSDSGSGSNSVNGSGDDPNFPPSSLRLLVVDDSVSNRKLLMRTLAKLGHRCVGAEDGAAAVRLLGESMKNGEPFDSVLLDFEMPIQNGPSAAAEMRSMGYKSCIVGVTGNVMSEDVRHFQCMGADDVLAKPLNVPDLEALWVDYGLVGGTGRLSDRKETGSPKNACVVENML